MQYHVKQTHPSLLAPTVVALDLIDLNNNTIVVFELLSN